MEKWKDVKGWEGIYQISNHGRLKSFKKQKTGYILSNKNRTGTYLSVVLCKKGMKSEATRIHRLVAEAFIPNPENKPEVNHKDLNKQKDHVDNLEWMTTKENYDHAVENGVDMVSGMNKYNKYIKTKTVLQMTLKGRLIGKFINCVEAAIATGVCSRDIHLVATKTEYKPGLIRKQAGGFTWRFYGD